MISAEVMDLIKKQATSKKLRLDLIIAIVEVESSGIVDAMRYERNYSYYHRPEIYARQNRISADTEKALQRFSYGLMQIMGGTARYLGYQGKFMDLLTPAEGLEWGCRFLKSVCREYPHLDDQIASYNAGHVKLLPDGTYKNQAYVDKVLNLLNVRLVQ